MTDRPPFRAEHVGSLLRPPALRAAFRAHAAGELDDVSFRAAQDAAVREAVSLQERLGFHGVNDGEFRRASYWSHFVEATEGFAVETARFNFHDDAGRVTEFLGPKVVGRISRGRSFSGEEFDFLRAVTRETPKLTVPSPPTMHFWSPQAWRGAGYRSEDAFLDDLARVFREEIADLARRGARYLQIDEVPLAMLCDGALREKLTAGGEEPDAMVARYIDLLNASVRDRPADMTVAVHLCRGNFKGQWLSEGSYAYVAERLFSRLDVDAFFLEYDTPRAGDFTPLAAVPAPRRVVLGLVSSKTPALEAADALRARIEEAARHMPLERLALSPQCGFASAVSGNPVTPQDQEAKLKLVVEVARSVWG